MHDKCQEHELTDREAEVLRLIASGMSAKEVAISLSIAPCTVEKHIEHVRVKTKTRNRVHMVAQLIRGGLLVLFIEVLPIVTVAFEYAPKDGI